ncbi:hypothetical protein BT63DRAFT_295345 [Microthyrium microscopicum]|uniref:Uncharacterized protein n=1 Tax=Microthyrium microscopicum TaxID=703497 RepID=A0A6A6U9K5_9PEZI|nr:hypothetical protein BT63DRAFT_295345 [Microthyrium microscopicum]
MHNRWAFIILAICYPALIAAQSTAQPTPAQPAPGPAPGGQTPSQASSAQQPQAQGDIPTNPKGVPKGSGVAGNSTRPPPKGGKGQDPATGYFGYDLQQKGDPNSTHYETANTNNTDDRNVTMFAEPDVHLNASVHVGEILLEVLNITAKVNLDAEVRGLVKFNAGVNAHIDRVRLLIQGVEARVLLEARLGNLVQIVSDVLDSLDLNPIIATLANDVNKIVNTTVGQLTGPPPKQKIQKRSSRIDYNILYSVNDYGGNTHTNRILEQNGEIVDEYLDNQGNRHGVEVIGYYERDMEFNGHDFPMSRNGQAVREREYVYAPFPGLSVVSAVYITDDGKVIGTQVISESFGGGTTSIENKEEKKLRQR